VRSGAGRAVDQGQAFVVHRVPGVVVGLEGKALFGVGLVGQEGAALAGVLAYLCPQDVSYASCGSAQEDAGGDFQEPAGEEPSESRGAVGEHDDRHQIGSSAP
jgi:hypothetical protein